VEWQGLRKTAKVAAERPDSLSYSCERTLRRIGETVDRFLSTSEIDVQVEVNHNGFVLHGRWVEAVLLDSQDGLIIKFLPGAPDHLDAFGYTRLRNNQVHRDNLVPREDGVTGRTHCWRTLDEGRRLHQATVGKTLGLVLWRLGATSQRERSEKAEEGCRHELTV
jgi:hypothetical protein